ncbi:hypothetical protein GCK72_023754 [Caenorhabditis remanei]|uniref:Phlebovirus glycoprotein G2 fusion domain-containing protein n=2 Tax=Caenorhabditis remanei TaxID=31234 RepID=A0A6A5FXP7_CAERE|nr:hypothetical protein GCK72_023754 [Caenorhabditis remanei]KAF1747292.1 hypothetical protein GCK72_023754 [Caenorhabditis remanei]
MRHDFWWFLCFLQWLQVNGDTGCDKIYTENDSSGSGKFECHTNGCRIKIDASPVKPIYLNLYKHNERLNIYVTSVARNQTVLLKK